MFQKKSWHPPSLHCHRHHAQDLHSLHTEVHHSTPSSPRAKPLQVPTFACPPCALPRIEGTALQALALEAPTEFQADTSFAEIAPGFGEGLEEKAAPWSFQQGSTGYLVT